MILQKFGHNMTIQLKFGPDGYADIVLENGGIADDSSLEPYVIVSLFSDRRADITFDIQSFDFTNNLRGWWGDTFRTYTIGSLLWQFDRTTVKVNLLQTARAYVNQALMWMIEQDIVAKIDVTASMLSSNALGITIILTKPDTTVQTFNYSFLY